MLVVKSQEGTWICVGVDWLESGGRVVPLPPRRTRTHREDVDDGGAEQRAAEGDDEADVPEEDGQGRDDGEERERRERLRALGGLLGSEGMGVSG